MSFQGSWLQTAAIINKAIISYDPPSLVYIYYLLPSKHEKMLLVVYHSSSVVSSCLKRGGEEEGAVKEKRKKERKRKEKTARRTRQQPISSLVSLQHLRGTEPSGSLDPRQQGGKIVEDSSLLNYDFVKFARSWRITSPGN